jgi:flavodoxin
MALFTFTTVAVLFGALVAHHCYVDNIAVESEPYEYKGNDKESLAVIYYSRAGSSQAVARTIAKQLNVPLYQIKTTSSKQYALNMSGMFQAATDKSHPEIEFPEEDVNKAKKLIVVSPTWMFQPAPPVWSFVESGAVKDKDVTMVTLGTTGTWQYDDNFFKSIGEQHGGRLQNHIHFARGPHAWPIPIETTLEEVQKKIAGVAF